jgi:chemotaxis signal transduction protein
VVEVAGRAFALLVDRIARILKLATADIVAPPENARVRFAIGVARDGDSTIYITAAERILRPGSMAQASAPRSEEA